MKTEKLVFELDKSKVLNSNVDTHRYLKSQIKSYLRTLGAEKGLELHREENRHLAEKRLNAIVSNQNWVLDKKKERARIKKKNPELKKNEVEEMVEEVCSNTKPLESVDSLPVDFVFDRCRVVVTVFPPSANRLDPPNLYPTVKPIIDGFTDASVWVDDNYKFIEEMSFRYGGPTKVSGLFRIEIDIIEVSD